MSLDSIKNFWRRNKRILWLMIAIVGLIFMILGILELLFLFEIEQIPEEIEPPGMDQVGYGSWFFALIGGIVAIGGWLYFHDYNKKHKKFEELMEPDSKAHFRRNIVEIEELAVDLGPQYESRVIEKKNQLKVKTR
ncbi:MAG: DUF3198 domain-containing protein [Thermoplasmatota archaeon]